jgi:hypothetical protein
MSGYVASARIVRASPRLARPGGIVELAERAQLPVPVPVPAETVELGTDLPAAGPTLAERWDAARERWAQLPFVLLDAESWRT